MTQPSGAPGAGVLALTLPIGEKGLREKVEAFRRAVQGRRPQEQATLTAQAAELYDLLPLPFTRREVDGIAHLFAGRTQE